MKRKTDLEERRSGPVKIYWEDVLEIQRAIKEVSSDVKISAENMEFESLDELREYCGSRTNTLEIAGAGAKDDTERYISVSVDIYGHGFYVRSSDDPAGTKVAQHLRHLLESRMRRIPHFGGEVSIAVCFNLLALAVLTHIVFANLRRDVPSWLWFISAILFLVCQIGLVGSFMRQSQIVLYRRRAAVGFWQRNRDDLTKLLIAAALGSALTLLLRRMFGI